MSKILEGGLRAMAVLSGLGTMYFEGQNQPAPGIWFAVGMICIGVALVPWGRTYDR